LGEGQIAEFVEDDVVHSGQMISDPTLSRIDIPDCLLGQLRMVTRFGIGDAFIEQPGGTADGKNRSRAKLV